MLEKIENSILNAHYNKSAKMLICEEMLEKIENSNLNELVITYNKNKMHIMYIDKNNYMLDLDNVLFHNLTKIQVKEFIDKIETIDHIILQTYLVLDNVYGYPELFSINVV